MSCQSREGTEQEMLLCHTQEYINKIRSSATMSIEERKELSSKYDGVYFHNVSTEWIKMKDVYHEHDCF